ncbi:unknown protein [Seminavis robusta]|uniref:DDE Tnp4 domain-containing protein n=1 Tax=Seminavis robusta TaxID=568900 RepID=A0A9N8HTB9_9STRA|nr:unknown protein [Seminavis robusta]|eukprot:Sro1259_g256891.1  (307) ;mRNA; r:4802-5722
MAAIIEPYILKPSYILRAGLKACHVDDVIQDRRCQATNVRVFKAHFGRHPLHLAQVWRDLQLFGIMTVEEAKEKKSFRGFMLANNFLRLYESEDVRNARFGGNYDYNRALAWDFVGRIASLKVHRIRCPTTWPVRLGASADGTQLRTNEPRDEEMRRNPKNYAYKYNFAGLNYLIVLSLWTNHIWFASGGDPGSTHDMTITRQEFVDMVPDGCRVIADDAFTGKTEREKSIFAVSNNLDAPAVKEFKGRAKARQETINKRLKDYESMSKPFIYGIEKAKLCFAAVITLIQYSIEDTSKFGEPLYCL